MGINRCVPLKGILQEVPLAPHKEILAFSSFLNEGMGRIYPLMTVKHPTLPPDSPCFSDVLEREPS